MLTSHKRRVAWLSALWNDNPQMFSRIENLDLNRALNSLGSIPVVGRIVVMIWSRDAHLTLMLRNILKKVTLARK